MNRRILGWTAHGVLGLLLATAVGAAQGGGFGGGFGGGGGAPLPDRDVVTRKQLLSPGAKDDWPADLTAGEVVLVSVKSQAFDPVIRVLAPDGKVVAENDDVHPGMQDALLLYRTPRAGLHKLQVTGARETAGGAYEMGVRRFVPRFAPVGATTSVTTTDYIGIQWFRVTVAARQTLALALLAGAHGEATLYGPNGEVVPPAEIAVPVEKSKRLDKVPAFGAKPPAESGRESTRLAPGSYQLLDRPPGDYYLRVNADRGEVALRVQAAGVQLTRPQAESPVRQLAADGLDLWRVEVTAGTVLRVHARSEGAPLFVRLGFPPTSATGNPATRPVGGVTHSRRSGFVELPGDPKLPNDLVALIRRTGTCEVEVYQPKGKATPYRLATSNPVRELRPGGEEQAMLPLGDSHYWAISGQTGDPVRLEVESGQFDPVLEIFRPDGSIREESDDPGGGPPNRNPVLLTQLDASGRFLARVHAVGDGGSGAYRMRRVLVPEKLLTPGVKAQGRIDISGNDIWTIQGRAGQVLVIHIQSNRLAFHTSLHRIDGKEDEPLAELVGGGENGGVAGSVRLPAAGRYRLWVTALSGPGEYSVRVFEAD